MRCKRTYVNTCLQLAGGLIKQINAASDWSVRLQRTDRSQGAQEAKMSMVDMRLAGGAVGGRAVYECILSKF